MSQQNSNARALPVYFTFEDEKLKASAEKSVQLKMTYKNHRSIISTTNHCEQLISITIL